MRSARASPPAGNRSLSRRSSGRIQKLPHHSLSGFWTEDGSAVHSDASEFSAAVQRAFARVAEFADCGAALFAVFECRWHFYRPLAGVLFLVVAVAFGVPDFA